MKVGQRFVTATPWKDYIIGPFGETAQTTTDAQIDSFISKTAATFFHPVGTAQMSAKNASYGVVDPDLRVKGVEGLRIVDASILVRICTFFEPTS